MSLALAPHNVRSSLLSSLNVATCSGGRAAIVRSGTLTMSAWAVWALLDNDTEGGGLEPPPADGDPESADANAFEEEHPSQRAQARRQLRRNRPLQEALATVPEAQFDRAAHLSEAREAKRRRSARSEVDGPSPATPTTKASPMSAALALKVPAATVALLATPGVSPMCLAPFVKVARAHALHHLEAARGGDDASDDLQALYRHCLGIDGGRVMTATVAALVTGVPEKKQLSYKKRLAFAAAISERESRAAIEGALVRTLPKENLLLYVDCYRADETPMRVRTASITPTVAEAAQRDVAAEGTNQPDLLQLAFPAKGKSEPASLPRKLLQSEQKYGLLVRSADDNYFSIIG